MLNLFVHDWGPSCLETTCYVVSPLLPVLFFFVFFIAHAAFLWHFVQSPTPRSACFILSCPFCTFGSVALSVPEWVFSLLHSNVPAFAYSPQEHLFISPHTTLDPSELILLALQFCLVTSYILYNSCITRWGRFIFSQSISVFQGINLDRILSMLCKEMDCSEQE